MKYQILYDTQPEKFLEKMDKHLSGRLLDKIDIIFSESPIPRDAKMLVGHHGVFRVRIGDWRIIYRINYVERKIIVFTIDKREHVYQ